MNQYYKEDLAYIHDVGFDRYALQSAPGILDILTHHAIQAGSIVDLGCGSGLSAQAFVAAGYDVLGIDISAAMIALARKRLPQATFQVASLFHTEIPHCNTVTAIGECLNYCFDPTNNHQTLSQLFHRIYDSLAPGGLFIFDLAEPGQVPLTTPTRSFTEGKDWVVLVEKTEDLERATLTRRIVTFRQVGDRYQRDDEIHQLQLYAAPDITHSLHQVGFQVQTQSQYGDFQLSKAHIAFIAKKLL